MFNINANLLKTIILKRSLLRQITDMFSSVNWQWSFLLHDTHASVMQQYIRIQSYEMFLQNKSLKNYALFCCDETNVTNNLFWWGSESNHLFWIWLWTSERCRNVKKISNVVRQHIWIKCVLNYPLSSLQINNKLFPSVHIKTDIITRRLEVITECNTSVYLKYSIKWLKL